MTNFQVVLTVVIGSIFYILFLFFAGYFFKTWGKVIVYIPGLDGFCPRFVKILDGSEVSLTLVFVVHVILVLFVRLERLSGNWKIVAL